jgi:hypothetical protein
MLTVVIVLNVLISLLCLYVTWRVWNLRKALAAAADILTAAERSTHAVLRGAPQAIERGQLGTSALRERYQQLEIQLQKVQQVLALLSLLQGVWRRTFRPRPKTSLSSKRSRRARYRSKRR